MSEQEILDPRASLEPLSPEDEETVEQATDVEAPTEEPEEASPKKEADSVDYEALEREDLEALKAEFPALRTLRSIGELENAMRFAELRELGLTPREAYLATSSPKSERVTPYDNRSHLHSSVPKSHGGRVDAMSIGELCEARELFSGLSDSEIVRLYKKVNS